MPEELKIGFYITLTLVAFFLYKKKKPRPTQLDLSGFKKRHKGKVIPGVRKVTAEVVEDVPERMPGNVFMHKGKKYDALKVLGLPLGADAAEIKKAYAYKAQSDSKNKEIYIKAYECLK